MEYTPDYPRFKEEVKEYAPAISWKAKHLTVVDFGGHRGASIELFLDTARVIYAVEPADINFEVLQEKFGDNPKVKLFKCAISNTNGTATLLSNPSDGGFSLKMGSNRGLVTETKTFAKFVEDNDITHIDILKVDVESAEWSIFNTKGFKDFAHNIDCVVGEVHGNDNRLFSLFANLGFDIEGDRGIFLATRKDEV